MGFPSTRLNPNRTCPWLQETNRVSLRILLRVGSESKEIFPIVKSNIPKTVSSASTKLFEPDQENVIFPNFRVPLSATNNSDNLPLSVFRADLQFDGN